MERQIASLLFERLSMNRDKEQVLALARRGQEIAVPGDVLKDPFVLDMYLPTEEELRAEITRERAEAEQVLLLGADASSRG